MDEKAVPRSTHPIAPSPTKTAAAAATVLTATSRELATGGLLCFNWAKASLPAVVVAVASVKAAESSA